MKKPDYQKPKMGYIHMQMRTFLLAISNKTSLQNYGVEEYSEE